MSSVKKAAVTALCTALCFVLPLAFHALGLGPAFSPIHIPVLLCGLVCDWPYGLFCGVAGPVLSSFSGMPSPAQLAYMVPELAAYGLFAGLFFSRIRTGRLYPDLYLALIPAMLLGRAAGGLAEAAVYLTGGRAWSAAMWAGAYLTGALPGIVLQLAAIPSLAAALMRARLVPERYPKRRETPDASDA